MRKLNEIYRIKVATALDHHVSRYNEFKRTKNGIRLETKLEELSVIENRLKMTKIKCFKYNHSIDDTIQNFTSFQSYLSLSEDGQYLNIVNRKPIENLIYSTETDK